MQMQVRLNVRARSVCWAESAQRAGRHLAWGSDIVVGRVEGMEDAAARDSSLAEDSTEAAHIRLDTLGTLGARRNDARD